MLQDQDPLWQAIDKFLKSFEDDFNLHGGLISRETQAASDALRVQLRKDRAKEAREVRAKELA